MNAGWVTKTHCVLRQHVDQQTVSQTLLDGLMNAMFYDLRSKYLCDASLHASRRKE
jgi:hypothetical protein